MKRLFIALAVVATVVFLPAEAVAQQSPRNLLVMIKTVPQTTGIRFAVDGKVFVSNSNGLAVTTVPARGTYTLKLLSSKVQAQHRTLTFSLWSDGLRKPTRDITVQSISYVEAGFNEERAHLLNFMDRQAGKSKRQAIDSATFVSTDGATRMLGRGPYRSLARRVVNDAGRLSMRPLSYRIEEVLIDGSTVPLQLSSRLEPAARDRTTITLRGSASTKKAAAVTGDDEIPMPVVWVIVASALIGGGLFLVLRTGRNTPHAAGEPSHPREHSRPTYGDETALSPRRLDSIKERARHGGIGALLVGMAAAVSTLAGLSSDSRVGLVVPVVIGAGIVLGLVALTRFVAFVEVLLIARASLDLSKLSGVEQSVGTDAGARAQDPASVVGVLFLVAATFWLLAQRRAGGLPGSPLRRAMAVFMAAGILSLLGTPRYGDSILEVVRILAVVVMFVVLEQLMADPKRMELLLRAVFLSALFPLAFTTVGILAGAPRTEVKGEFSRLLGTFTQSNVFGRYLMLILIFGVAIYPYVWRPYKRWLLLVLPLATIYLVLTYTLSAVIATVLGLVVVAILQSKRLLVALVVVGACLLLLFPQLGARFAELGTQAEAASFRPQQSTLEWRFSYWADVFPLARENPITGIGLGTTSTTTESERAPHNDFLRAYVETGVIGFFAYLAMMASLLALGRRAIRVAPLQSLDRGVAVGYAGCAVAFVTVSLVANVMSNVVILWYFFALAAAASSVVRRRTGGWPFRRNGERRGPEDMMLSTTVRG